MLPKVFGSLFTYVRKAHCHHPVLFQIPHGAVLSSLGLHIFHTAISTSAAGIDLAEQILVTGLFFTGPEKFKHFVVINKPGIPEHHLLHHPRVLFLVANIVSPGGKAYRYSVLGERDRFSQIFGAPQRPFK
jgi:hypothetical protein